jgi:hypothetical protein
LVNECKEFITLKNRNKGERNPPVGTPQYLLSKLWLKKYKTYIFYKDVKKNNKPVSTEEDLHPGPITNDEDLCETDMTKNLIGTGTIEQYEKTCVDKYLKSDVRERYDYKVINQELWQFLYSKYGGSEIKRYSVPQGQYWTTIEVRLKPVPLVILPTSKLYQGGE